MATDLFKELIPSILITGKDVLDDEKSYLPYLVNKALSFHLDCILYCNEMNQRPHLDKKLQYDYLRLSVRKYKRPYQKWQKKEKLEHIGAIKEYYSLSDTKAVEVLRILTGDQIAEIIKMVSKGGMTRE